MTLKGSGPGKPGGKISKEEMNRIIAKARQTWKEREQSYREQSLKIHPWVCGRCGRNFTRKNLQETVVLQVAGALGALTGASAAADSAANTKTAIPKALTHLVSLERIEGLFWIRVTRCVGLRWR